MALYLLVFSDYTMFKPELLAFRLCVSCCVSGNVDINTIAN